MLADQGVANNPEQMLGSLERAAIWFDFYDTEFFTIPKDVNLFCEGKMAKEQKLGYMNYLFFDHFCSNMFSQLQT